MKHHYFDMQQRYEFRCAGRGRGDAERDGGRDRGFDDRGGMGRGHHFAGRGGDPFGGGRERLFDAGDIKLVILKLLADTPSYGYQLIKTMEEQLSGGYTPSAGVIYPTLTLLEEEGLAQGTVSDTGKKVFSVTPEGIAFLDQNSLRVGLVFDRLKAAGEQFRRRRSPEIMKAFQNLRGAVEARVSRETITPEHVRKIADAINAAASAIDGF
jgi:DNA-binding PadR family transcriptional regulator